MNLKEMFEGIANSPASNLSESISSTDTVIQVDDISIIPSVPNVLTIGYGEDRETVKVTQRRVDGLVVERGYEKSPKAWDEGTIIRRTFTHADLKAIQDNILILDNVIGDKANIKHAHTIEDVTDLDEISKENIDELL